MLRTAAQIYALACMRRGWGQANAKAHQRGSARLSQQAALAERRAQCTHNPSLKRTPNGLGRLQARWLLSFRRPKPLGSAYLKRYASPAESESKLALFRSVP